MTEKTPHQIMIDRIERERDRIQRLLDDKDGLEQMDVTELGEIAIDLRKVHTALDDLVARIESLAERLRA